MRQWWKEHGRKWAFRLCGLALAAAVAVSLLPEAGGGPPRYNTKHSAISDFDHIFQSNVVFSHTNKIQHGIRMLSVAKQCCRIRFWIAAYL